MDICIERYVRVIPLVGMWKIYLSIYLYAESCGDVYCKSYIQNDNLLGYKCHIGNYTCCMNIKAINGEW